MITAVHHIALILSSEECLDCYKGLGFAETFRKEREYDTVVLLDGYGIQLEVFIDPRHPGRGEVEPLGPRHFALQVSNSLEMEFEGLRAERIKRDWLGRRYVFIHDPDGNVVELREEEKS
jgi:glyoxylase I family protein